MLTYNPENYHLRRRWCVFHGSHLPFTWHINIKGKTVHYFHRTNFAWRTEKWTVFIFQMFECDFVVPLFKLGQWHQFDVIFRCTFPAANWLNIIRNSNFEWWTYEIIKWFQLIYCVNSQFQMLPQIRDSNKIGQLFRHQFWSIGQQKMPYSK